MSDDRNRTRIHGGLLFAGLFVVMVVAGLIVFLVVAEMPRRARGASIERITNSYGGNVEVVSSCPAWLEETWFEDYFTYVVAVRIGHHQSLDRDEGRYLAPLRDLEVLHVRLPPGANRIIESLPYSRDLVELHLIGPEALPPARDVPALEELRIAHPRWGPGDARVLGNYTNLTRLELLVTDEAIIEEALDAVSGLPHLSEVVLEYSYVTPRALEHLARLPNLLLLDLSNTGITVEGAEVLAGIPSLQHLELDNLVTGNVPMQQGPGLPGEMVPAHVNRIDSNATRHIAGLSDLRFLQLDNTDIDDEAMTHVARLPILQFLYVQRTRVGNAGVRSIADLVHLKRLNLSKTYYAEAIIDDEAVEPLLELTDLEALNLHYTDITREGLDRLILGLPRTAIAPLRPRHTPSPLKREQRRREAGR